MGNSRSDKEKNNQIEHEPFDMMAALAQEVELVITQASEAASREAEQELERILQEYEQKTKQIVLKIREETKSKTAEIVKRLSEAVMIGIEKASARAVAGVVTESSKKAGALTRKMQEAVEKEAGQAVARVAVGLGGGIQSTDNHDPQKDVKADEKGADEVSQETEPATEDEGIELQRPTEVENFDQWLTQ